MPSNYLFSRSTYSEYAILEAAKINFILKLYFIDLTETELSIAQESDLSVISQNEGSVSLQRCLFEKSWNSFIGTLVPGHLGLALNELTILRDCVLRYMRVTDVW